MNNSKKRTTKTIGFMLLFSVLVISVFLIVRTRTSSVSEDSVSSMSEVEKLISKDIEGNYPSSPKEVLKMYNKLTKNMHNEDLEDGQLEKLVEQMRLLFDEELLASKDYDNTLLDMKVEISDFKKMNQIIMSYTIESSSSVVYWESEEKEYASMVSSYTMKKDADYSKVFEEFAFRKDADGKWKILGWRLSDKTEITTD
jgi:hypothetical protein